MKMKYEDESTSPYSIRDMAKLFPMTREKIYPAWDPYDLSKRINTEGEEKNKEKIFLGGDDS